MDQTTNPVSPTNSEVTWDIAATFWWAWLWRTVLVALSGGFVLGFMTGIVGALLGVDIARITIFSQILGGLFGVVVGVYFIKTLLDKDFKTFKVTIVRK